MDVLLRFRGHKARSLWLALLHLRQGEPLQAFEIQGKKVDNLLCGQPFRQEGQEPGLTTGPQPTGAPPSSPCALKVARLPVL